VNQASVSIVIAASAQPQAIDATFASIAAQTLRPAEIIIAGAGERLPLAGLRQLASSTAIPLRILTHADGPYFAQDLNTALPIVRGEYVSFVEAGDLWQPDALARLAAPIGETVWSHDGSSVNTDVDPLQSVVEGGHAINAMLFPTELADRLGPLDPATAPWESWDIALQLSMQAPGRAIGSTPAPVGDITPCSVGAAAQVLRKHAIYLKTRLAHYAQAAAHSLESVGGESTATQAAIRSLSLPYLEHGDDPGAPLVFLVSLPRSGSSLVQRVLASHPDVHTLPEPWIMLNACHGLRAAGVDGDYEPALAARAVDGFLEHTGGGRQLYYEAARTMSDRLYTAALHGSGARMFLDKTPRYYHILPELRAIYPNARFVFLLRHPLAVATSAIDTWFDGDVDSFRENRNFGDCVEGPRKILETVAELGDAAVCVHYENLVASPESEIRRLCNAIGLGFDSAMLDYSATSLPESEFGDQTNVDRHTQPVGDYAEVWRQSFSDEQRGALGAELLDELGEELFAAMGYDYDDARRLVGESRSDAQQQPPSADELTRDGEIRFAEGDAEAAEALFHQAIELDPGFAVAHNNLGVMHSMRGENDRAIEFFVAALAADPCERDAMINLIECASTENRLGDTLVSLAAYLQAVPGDEEIMGYARDITEAIEQAEQPSAATREALVPALPRGPEILVRAQAPRISIVTPSYNQGDYLEATIDSILSQNYPNLDYIIMDGGSTDQSVSIIKRYEKYFTHWQSGKDDGQYAAIEAGLQRSDGEIMAWLNSDDKYHPDALWKVSYAFMTRPQVDWLTGLYTFWDERGTLTGVLDPVYWTQSMQLDPNEMRTVQQESTFWRRSLWDKAGARLATDLYYAGDWDLWTRFFAHADLHTLEWTLGGYRFHEGQKVGNDTTGYTAEANVLLEQETLRLADAGITQRDDIPAPVRLDDPDLIELREWRASNLPANRFQTKRAESKGGRRKYRSGGTVPSLQIVTSLKPDSGEDYSAIESWIAAGWPVVSVNGKEAAAEIRARYPAVEVVETADVSALRDEPEAVRFRAILAQASTRRSDFVGIIKPDVVIDAADTLAENLGGIQDRTLVYGEQVAVNSAAVLDGFADGYGYFIGAPQHLARFNPGQLTFGHDWWIHWLLMTALADGFALHKISERHAYRIKKDFRTPYDEQVVSSKACIASILAQYLPAEFKTIPSLKLSFDIESADFEKFARSYVASRAA